MENVNRATILNATDTELVLHNGDVVILRTDIPTNHLSYDERYAMTQAVTKLHEMFKEKLKATIDLDNYIQIGSKDTLVIANEAEHCALVYPNGTFGKYNALFYLDWLPKDCLVEVLEEEGKMAKFVYKK